MKKELPTIKIENHNNRDVVIIDCKNTNCKLEELLVIMQTIKAYQKAKDEYNAKN